MKTITLTMIANVNQIRCLLLDMVGYYGDGTMDSSNTFVYNKHYTSAGNYIVTLVAVGAEGCKDTMSMYVQVRSLSCTGVLKFVNLQDGSNWNVDPGFGKDVSSSVSEITNELTYKLYPNPNYGSFSLTFNKNLQEDVQVRIVDLLGRVVYSSDFDKSAGNEINIETSNLANGSYMLLVNGNSYQYSDKKFVLIH